MSSFVLFLSLRQLVFMAAYLQSCIMAYMTRIISHVALTMAEQVRCLKPNCASVLRVSSQM